jgi:Flp pilus assembly protein TadD
VLIQLGRPAEAIAPLERAVSLASDASDSFALLGLAHLADGDAEQGAIALEAALLREPFNPAVWVNLGVARARLGNSALAGEHFERALELGTFPVPRLHVVYTDLAILALARGDDRTASTHLRHALHLVPEHRVASDLLSAIRRGERPHAELLLHDTVEIFGQVTSAPGR